MFCNQGIHSYNHGNFGFLHLNLDKKVFFKIKNNFDVNIVGMPIDDLLTVVPKLKTKGTFEISDSGILADLKDKTLIKFEVGEETSIVSSYVPDAYLGGKNKNHISVEINNKNLLDEIKKVLEQMKDYYTFERSCIDWTKNEKEKQKSNEVGKFISKIDKQIKKI